MNEIKLIIADDHQLFRNGLEELLRKYNDIKVVKSVADGFEFMEVAKSQLEADIVLLDITMPNIDGFQVLKELKTLDSNIKPIVISMHNDGNYIAKCAKMGAYGYLLKNTDESELILDQMSKVELKYSTLLKRSIKNFLNLLNFFLILLINVIL